MANINLNDCFPLPADGSARGPLPKQAEFLSAILDPKGPKFIGYYGGFGCVRGDTRVITERGLIAITDITLQDRVWTGSSFSPCSIPFPKGQGRLVTVVHEQGQFVAAEQHHVALADGSYQPVGGLRLGDSLILPGLPEIHYEASPLEWPQDVPHWMQKVGDFLEHCSACIHQYGLLPQAALKSALAWIPSLIDVLGYNPSSYLRGDQRELILDDSHRGLLYTLFDRIRYEHLLVPLGKAVAAQALKIASELPLADSPVSQRSPDWNEYHLLTPEPYRNQSVSCDPSVSPPCLKSSRILSVTTSESSEWYWDIQVPGAECYITADGTVHHNSGKTLSLNIAMLTQAVVHGGEYVIGRLNMPELRRTTMKNFLEICPKELLLEHRVADAEVHVKSATGKPAIVYFVGLDEPQKLDSLNLSGFAIDEASFVPEESFLRLQGRLRNPLGLRKGLVVGNPRGHNWVHRRFVSKKAFTDPKGGREYKMIVAPSTENRHLPSDYVPNMLANYSRERIARDVYGSFDSFEGMIYNEFDRALHVVRPFRIPEEWTRVIGADHGYTNPAAAIWGAEDYDGNIFVYQEFYRREWLVQEICQGNKKTGEPGLIELSKGQNISGLWIDPSTKGRSGVTGESPWDAYAEYLPTKWGPISANNDVSAGIDRVKNYMKPSEKTGKPRLFIFDTCTNLIDEISEYKWEPISPGAEGSKNESEKPHKYKDHACDAMRYMLMSRPEAPKHEDMTRKLRDEVSLEGSVRRELYGLRHPTGKDPFGDDFS